MLRAGRTGRSPDGWWEGEIHPPSALGDLLPEADYVVLTIPHTPETEGLFSAPQFKLMKPTASIINIARGPTIRIDDLDAALRSGEIGGAALDVFEIEPLPKEHPLWTAPNVVITPHVAVAQMYQPGTSTDPRGFPSLADERVFATTAENIRRFLRGQELLNPVDKEKWF